MKKKLLVIFIGIVLLGFLGGVLAETTFTPIFCNDYEFTCCVGKVEQAEYHNITDESSWICPLNAYMCDVLSVSGNKEWNVGSRNCHLDTSLVDEYVCDNQISGSKEMRSNEEIYLHWAWGVDKATAQIKVTYPSLEFCGRSGCSIGIEVSGADGCKFNPINGIVYTSTSSLDGRKDVSSYTVPMTSCVLAFQSGDRHICGYKEESCSIDSDCSGHTYGNQECNGRSLQTYGCVSYGNPINEKDRGPFDSGWGNDVSKPIQSGNANFGNRCDIVSSEQVQCCGDTDCGSEMFCDTSSFTCQEEVKCEKDSDCGVSTQCDTYSNILKKPICNNGKCNFKEEKVECCSNNNCDGGYCDQYKCRESAGSKTLEKTTSQSSPITGAATGLFSSKSNNAGPIFFIICLILGGGIIAYYFYSNKTKTIIKEQVSSDMETSGKHCTKCGNILRPNAEFCTKCGKRTYGKSK